MRILVLIAAGCGCLSLAAVGARAEAYSPRVGQPHPDLVLPSIVDGEPVALSQFRGKRVLLIHFAPW